MTRPPARPPSAPWPETDPLGGADGGPAPDPPRRRGAPREVLLGGLLLLAILAISGWQWQVQQDQFAAQYAQAQAAARRADWPTSLLALLRLRHGAAHYRDSDALAAQAVAQLTTQALSGTLALRPAANPPGLYHYGAAGWQWLAGSTASSRVVAFCPDGDVLVRTPDRSPGGRRLVRNSPDGTLRAVLALADATRFQCARAGVWGEYIATEGLVDSVAYQASGNSAPIPARLPAGWWVEQIAPDGAHLLVIDATVGTLAQPRTRLYLTAPDGGQPQLLVEEPAGLSQVLFSPDSRYVLLLLVVSSQTGGVFTDSAVLLDTLRAAAPRQLATVSFRPSARDAGLAATFIAQGPRRGQILLNWPSGNAQGLQLTDPAHPAPIWAGRLAQPPVNLSILDARSADGVLLLLGRDWPADSGEAPVQAIELDPATGLHALSIPLAREQRVEETEFGAGWLVYTASTNFSRSPHPYSIMSLPLSQWAAPATAATQIYSGMSGIYDSGSPWHLGAGLLAYRAADRRLHIRALDGSLDWPLDETVTDFFDPRPSDLP